MKQKTVALSTPQAKTYAIMEATKQAVHTKQLLQQLFPKKKIHINIFSDSTTAIAICKHRTKHNTTKHFGIHCQFVRELIDNETIMLKYIASAENPSDIFTKPLAISIFEKLRKLLGMSPK